ncbi:hypothetical protein [Longispora albida]|uniref:hypothetical protein n=1 Tax=Longispora albida TaxID=203523 RepID=UPI00035F5D56|nr:hypothetical protein [Longispora albida]
MAKAKDPYSNPFRVIFSRQCNYCNGTGQKSQLAGGTDILKNGKPVAFSHYKTMQTCPLCNGTGKK